MTILTTRASLGTALSHSALDANFIRDSQAKTGSYFVAIGDNRSSIEVNLTATISLPDAAAISTASDTGDFQVTIKNTGAGVVTIARATPADTIDGVAGDVTLAANDFGTYKVNQAGDGYVSISGVPETLNSKILINPEIDQIVDANGDEIVVFTSNATPVNQPAIVNSAAGLPVSVVATGDDANVGMRVLSKGDGDADLVAVGNGNVNLDTFGTGDVRKNTIPVYGMVVLNTPILKVTNTGNGSVAKTPVSIAADVPTGTAVKAIIRISSELDSGGVAANFEWLAGHPAETFATETHRATQVRTPTTTAFSDDSNTMVVNLDGSQQFSYQLIASGSPTSQRTTIHLLGYFI